MGTSIENGGGGGEEVEEEEIPWSCVDETIREELIMRLNPEYAVSGNNWRGLAGRLEYTTAQIMAIESEKGNNTREFFNNYHLRGNSTFNEVFQALKEMDRQDCVKILEKHLPRIKRNLVKEKEREARLLEEDMTTPCRYHYPQHSMGVGRSCGGCTCGPVPPPHPSMGPHHHAMCSMPPPSHTAHHNSYNNHHSSGGGYPSSPCCHMGAMSHHPLQMSPMGSCMAAAGGVTCGNHSPTKTGSHTCARQQSCTSPHLQMDISQSIPKCTGAYYYNSGPPTPSIVNHSNIAFSDHATSPTPGQYYNVRDPSSYSPKISPETNKPYNFSVSSANQAGIVENSFHLTNGRASVNDQRNGGTHKMEQQYPQNIVVNGKGGSRDHLMSNNFSSQFSNENNSSYPSTSSLPHYENGVGELQPQQTSNHHYLHPHPHHQQQQQQQQHYQNSHNYSTGSNNTAASAAAKLELDPHLHNSVVDSKKSLQKLTEISKMPDKYQPTDEYKTFVADQDVDNKKKQRGRMARTNGSIASSNSSTSTASSASSSSQTGGATVTKQNGNQQVELSQMAGLSLATNNVRDKRSNVYVTYSKDHERHKKDVLRLTIFLNDNDNSVWADVATSPGMAGRGVEPYQEYYDQADFILVCISPKYLQDISNNSSSFLTPTNKTTTNHNGSSPSSSTSSTPTSLPIHTYEIYQMMKAEHQRSVAYTNSAAANGVNSAPNDNKGRFVSLLFGNMSHEQVPSWLRRYPVYKWPQDYEDIGWFLKKPNEWVCGQTGGGM